MILNLNCTHAELIQATEWFTFSKAFSLFYFFSSETPFQGQYF